MVLFAVALGFVLGAVGLSAAVTIVHMLISPELMRDGLYPLLWLIYTGPPGGVLGAASGAAIALSAGGRHGTSAKVCIIVGGIFALIAGILTAWLFAGLLFGDDNWKVRWAGFRAWLPILGFPLWWAIVLFRKGWNA